MFRTITAAATLLVLATPALAGSTTSIQCSQYGEGFVYSPDTGMCIKVSGEFRADYGVTNGKTTGLGSSVKGSLDARGNSDFGPFRAVIEPTAHKY